jgi:adenylate cyclase
VNPDAPEHVPEKPASEDKPASEVIPDKRAPGRLRARLRRQLQVASAALASIAAVGAIAGGLVGYWNVWKTVRTDLFQTGQKDAERGSGSA